MVVGIVIGVLALALVIGLGVVYKRKVMDSPQIPLDAEETEKEAINS